MCFESTDRRELRLPFILLACVLAVSSACGDDDAQSDDDTEGESDAMGLRDAMDDDESDSKDDAKGDSESEGSLAEDDTKDDEEPSPRAAASQRYVIATAVSSDEMSTTYVKTLTNLDGQELSLRDAREFGGWSDMKVIGNWVFVSGGETSVVERFSVDDNGQLQADGRIGFADYAQTADLYMHLLISPTKAYFTTDTEYVIWNPTTLEITGTIPFPELPTRDGIEPFVTMDRGAVIRDNKLFHAASWTDTMAYKMTPDSRVLVVDVENDEIEEVLELPCPDINVATIDDKGNIYFSNWVYSPGATLVNDQAKACSAKIPADDTAIDESWTVTFADVTGGHEGANLVYAGNGKALFSVFREDKMPFDKDTEIFDWLFGDTNWDYASMDLETHEVTTLPDLGEQSGGFYAYQLGDKFVLLSPQGDYSETSFVEVSEDGTGTEVLRTNGWSTRIYLLGEPEEKR